MKDQQWDEDENEDVLDAWDAEEEDEEKKKKEKKTLPRAESAGGKTEGRAAASQKAPKAAAAAAAAATMVPINETEAERRARLDKLVKERDLESAMELFGINGQPKKSTTNMAGASAGAMSSQPPAAASPPYSFETASPGSMAEFDQFSRLIGRKLEGLEGHRYYPQFLEGLVNMLVGRREAPEIRKISGVLANMATLKAKQARASATRGSSAGVAAPVTLNNTKASKGSSRFDDCFAGYDDGDGFDE